jgi:ribosome-binding factor A
MSRRSGHSSERGASQRQLRVGEELRHALARLIERGVLRDPALVGRSITVSEVRVSPDLKNATAFVTPLGGQGGPEAVKALNRAAAHLRGLVAGEVRLRHAPRIAFLLDTSFDNASRIERALKEIAPREGGDGA